MNKINIAIDGPVASGKGTIVKLLAKKLNYKILDSGSLYRALAYYFLKNNLRLENYNEDILNNINLSFNENQKVLLNGEEVEQYIRTPEIGNLASALSSIKEIRMYLNKIQQEITKDKGYILDGRDAGTLILPNAELKIYLDANVEERARRRFKDYNSKYSFEEVLEEVKKRDYNDLNKEYGALIQAEDAIYLDNTNMEIDKQVDFIYNLAIK